MLLYQSIFSLGVNMRKLFCIQEKQIETDLLVSGGMFLDHHVLSVIISRLIFQIHRHSLNHLYATV